MLRNNKYAPGGYLTNDEYADELAKMKEFYATIGYEQMQEDRAILETRIPTMYDSDYDPDEDVLKTETKKDKKRAAELNRDLVRAARSNRELTADEYYSMRSSYYNPEIRPQKYHKVVHPRDMDIRNPAHPYYDHPAARPPI